MYTTYKRLLYYRETTGTTQTYYQDPLSTVIVEKNKILYCKPDNPFRK